MTVLRLVGVQTIERDNLLANATAVGAQFVTRLRAIDHNALSGVRGRGLWLALELAGVTSGAVEKASRDSGFLVNAVQPAVIRIAPPLILSVDQAEQYVSALPEILDAASSQGLS